MKTSTPIKLSHLGAIVCLIITLVSGSAVAGPLITDTPSGNGNTFDLTATLGFVFTVGASDISVTQLGLLDYGNNGFNSSHAVGIWNSDGSSLLATVTLGSGTSGTTVILTGTSDSFRFVDLVTPIILTAGTTYRAGAAYVADGDLAYQVYAAAPFPVATVDASIGSLSGRAYRFGAGLAYPNSADGGSLAIVGPNFIASPVPEPSTYALFGIGAVTMVRMFRRRA